MSSKEFKYFIFASIISAENDSLTEEVKQDIISRYDEHKNTDKEWNDYNWEYILEPIGDKEKIQKVIEIIKED